MFLQYRVVLQIMHCAERVTILQLEKRVVRLMSLINHPFHWFPLITALASLLTSDLLYFTTLLDIEKYGVQAFRFSTVSYQ